MRFIRCSILFAAALCLGAGSAAGSEKLESSNTYAVIVGVLSWEQGTLTTYAPEIRQDVALHEQLKALGVPEDHMTLLLDQAASRTAIEEAVAAIAKQANEESTLIIYYAGHGMRNGDEGIFACYDIRTQEMEQTGWRHSNLTSAIKQNFRGDKVLLFADCCFSGTLEKVAKDLSEHGLQAASLTSASATNTSTNNWTFTLSLVEALSGQPIADANGDGVITISEAADEVHQAMSHYERQRNGFAVHQLPDDFQLTRTKSGAAATAHAEQENLHGFKRGQYVSAKYKNKRQMARVLDGRESDAVTGELLLQFQAYNQRPTTWVLASDVRLADEPKLKNEPPDPLPAEEALQKASLDGKFNELLAKFQVAQDFRNYGAFRDYGEWTGASYAGHRDLPRGYWVYVYPNWYIWKSGPEMQVAAGRDPFVVRNQNKAQIQPYDARQMAGVPDSPVAGDVSTCWAAETADEQNAWVELDYDVALRPSEIHVYENCGPGAIYQVTAVIDKEETLLWKGIDPTPQDAQKGISKFPIDAEQEFSTIRLYLNCKAVNGWNEIDAVALVNEKGKLQWAVDARASSTYSQNTNIEFVDPFQSEAERIAEGMAELNAQIRQHKANIRDYEQLIEHERTAIEKLYEQLDEIKDQ